MAGKGARSIYQNLKTEAQRTHFLGYVQGDNNITVARKPPATSLVPTLIGIVLFGRAGDLTSVDPTKYVPVTMTVQARQILAEYPPSLLTTANIEIASAGVEGIRPAALKEPARAVVRLRNKANPVAAANKISGMTSRPYRQMNDRTGTMPFGRSKASEVIETDSSPAAAPSTLQQADYFEVARAIEAELKEISPTSPWLYAGASFKPEKWKIASDTASYMADTDVGTLPTT